MSDEQCIVIDNGSSTIKIGISGSYLPSHIIPSVIGTPRHKFKSAFTHDEFIGDDCIKNIEYVSLTHLIDHGHYEDFDLMEKIWEYSFNKMEVYPNCRPILLSEPPFTSPIQRTKTAELFFEKFCIDDLNITIGGLLSMYGIGKMTGTVLEMGDGVLQCLPVLEGYVEKGSTSRVDFGGSDISMYLQRLLCERGYLLTSREDFQTVTKIKESLCFCSLNPYEDELKSDLFKSYTLPDGKVLRDGETNEIDLTVERFYPCEVLFNPTIVQSDFPSIIKTVWDAIQSCPIQQRTSLTNNVILSGGNSLFENLDKRIEIELRDIVPIGGRNKVTVNAPPDRLTLSWRGGSILSEPNLRDVNHNRWICNAEWMEYGSAIVLKKTGIE